ncbi:MAG: O-antigen ligase family protein [Victivallaceae bacterium]|nr:O-antigen ligase family protein [Victivallaceae bacterium]
MIDLKKNNWQVLSFYICALLFYPLVWPRLFIGRLTYWSDVNLFTPGLIAILCCSLLLFNTKTLFSFFSCRVAKLIAVAFSFILLISFIQIIVCYEGQANYLWTSIYWIAIPLFCAVNRRKIEKYLPFFIIFLGVTTVIQSFQELSLGRPLVGIPGNRNWNAGLIALSLPFIYLGVHKYFRKNYILSIPAIIFLIIIAGVLIFHCESKAVVLALLIASCSVIVLSYWRKLPFVYWLRGGILLAALGVVFLVVFKEHLFAFLRYDQRVSLWSAALELIGQNLWFGCGPEVFESAYAPHISADYYFGKFTSIRHPHAHNHFLQFAATMGIPALIAWCSVLFYAVGKNLRQAAGQGNWNLKLYLFTFILLFIHSMLDIVVLSWPMGCIFLILFGILLGRALDEYPRKELKQAKFIPQFCGVLGICLAILLLNYLYYNFLGSMHYRNAKLMLGKKDKKTAFAETEKSIAARMTPQNTYLAAKISLYDFKDPKACLKFLDQVDSLGFENYEHNNLLRAKALAELGKLPESLLYFAKEQQNFPLSCVNLYYYRIVLFKLGKKQQADAIGMHLKRILKMKGFNEKMLPQLLKNPIMDLRFRYYNGEGK